MYAITFEGRLFLTPYYKTDGATIEVKKYIEIRPLFHLKIEELKSFADMAFGRLVDIKSDFVIIIRQGTHIINLGKTLEVP